MNINEYDNTLNNTMFLSKIDNIFIQLLMGVMKGDLTQVDHKISDDVYNKYQKIVDENNSQNIRQMYDELNVKDSRISDIRKTDEGVYVDVILNARYMDYKIDKDTFKKISGNNSSRIEVTYNMTFFKSNNAVDEKNVRRCPTCGHSMDTSLNGKCDYCGSIYDTEKYDYVLIDIL